MDTREYLTWVVRLEAGAELVKTLQRCRALAVDAGLPDAVHSTLLNTVNLASELHNSRKRLRVGETLESLGDSEAIRQV